VASAEVENFSNDATKKKSCDQLNIPAWHRNSDMSSGPSFRRDRLKHPSIGYAST
jgi:hypothetical protein